ncbi:MAG: MOSC domain-containing protein [Acidimicrobiia bacterium]
MEHVTAGALAAGTDAVRRSPADGGRVDLIVRRPAPAEREELTASLLDTEVGLVGDSWPWRPRPGADDGRPDPDRQLALMNSRAAALVAVTPERWALAGDQLYVDLDLSAHNLPPGTGLAVGSAVLEVTSQPHLGCQKFSRRFGPAALRWVNSDVGRELRLRGLFARVVTAGAVEVGDAVRKL